MCQKCGDIGFSVALVYCGKCLANALHRQLLLGCMPVTVDEYVTWFCEDCESKSALNAVAVIRDHQISEFHPEFENGRFRLRLDEAEARVSDPERLLDDQERSLVESKGEISTRNVRIAGLEHEVSDVLQASIKSDKELNAIQSEVSFLRKDNESVVKDIETAVLRLRSLKLIYSLLRIKLRRQKGCIWLPWMIYSGAGEH
ncbi:uncharacterized protein LOC118344728 [Juglans regia]|uniref:Uncharacterized protein LOC118344728 n=1 Tax=Juglans regia TaxID=51240 RepID=A0A6P9E354_JUGRE|nr:uncharacterized protein LOC118344728 [Juglans regia]